MGEALYSPSTLRDRHQMTVGLKKIWMQLKRRTARSDPSTQRFSSLRQNELRRDKPLIGSFKDIRWLVSDYGISVQRVRYGRVRRAYSKERLTEEVDERAIMAK